MTETHGLVHRSQYGSDLTPRYFVPSVYTAARVLALLSRYSTKSLTLSEIMTSLEVSKATCLRVLKTLEMHGLLKFEAASKRYSLGYYCVVLGLGPKKAWTTWPTSGPSSSRQPDRRSSRRCSSSASARIA